MQQKSSMEQILRLLGFSQIISYGLHVGIIYWHEYEANSPHAVNSTSRACGRLVIEALACTILFLPSRQTAKPHDLQGQPACWGQLQNIWCQQIPVDVGQGSDSKDAMASSWCENWRLPGSLAVDRNSSHPHFFVRRRACLKYSIFQYKLPTLQPHQKTPCASTKYWSNDTEDNPFPHLLHSTHCHF